MFTIFAFEHSTVASLIMYLMSIRLKNKSNATIYQEKRDLFEISFVECISNNLTDIVYVIIIDHVFNKENNGKFSLNLLSETYVPFTMKM